MINAHSTYFQKDLNKSCYIFISMRLNERIQLMIVNGKTDEEIIGYIMALKTIEEVKHRNYSRSIWREYGRLCYGHLYSCYTWGCYYTHLFHDDWSRVCYNKLIFSHCHYIFL